MRGFLHRLAHRGPQRSLRHRLGGADGPELQLLLGGTSGAATLSGGRLAEIGLIEAYDAPRLSAVARRLFLPRLDARRVSDLLLGAPARASLRWDDFEHLGNWRDLAAKVVAAAGDGKAGSGHGSNLLFYGPPGTGKSEFAKTLGAASDSPSSFAERLTDDSSEPNRRERIAALLIANAIGGIAKDRHRRRRGRRPLCRLRRGGRPRAPRQQGVHEQATGARKRADDLDHQRHPTAGRADHPAHEPRVTLSKAGPRGAQGHDRADRGGRGPALDEAAALDLARSPAPPALIENAILRRRISRGRPLTRGLFSRAAFMRWASERRQSPGADPL